MYYVLFLRIAGYGLNAVFWDMLSDSQLFRNRYYKPVIAKSNVLLLNLTNFLQKTNIITQIRLGVIASDIWDLHCICQWSIKLTHPLRGKSPDKGQADVFQH